MLNLNNYYIVVIIADPTYYKSINRFNRRIKDSSYDPFSSISFEQSIVIGIPVLLKKIVNIIMMYIILYGKMNFIINLMKKMN